MAYDDDDSDNSRNYGSSGNTSAPAPLTKEAAKQQFQQFQNQSANALNSAIHTREKNGKTMWLGMEVPKESAPLLQLVTSLMPTFIGEMAGSVIYENTSKIFKLVNKSATTHTAHKVGLGAAAAFTTALIAAQPATEIASALHARKRERKKIRKEMETILATDKKSYNNNEVIKTAIDRTQTNLVSSLKHVAADLPTIILSGCFSYGSFKTLKKDKTEALKNVLSAEKQATSGLSLDTLRYQEMEARKARFVKETGLTDEAAIKKAWERQEDKVWEEVTAKHTSSKKDEDESKNEKIRNIAIPTAALVSSLFKQSLIKDTEHEKKHLCAYELIMKLKEDIEAGHKDKSTISTKVIEIFQRNEKDRSRSAFGPALIEKLQPLAERLGEVMANDELDPLALVNLVGDGQLVNKRRFISDEKCEELIDSQRKVFSTHSKTPLDEFLADFQNPTMIMKAVRENLQTLSGDQKALFASLFSDEVLLHAGIRKCDILPLRTQGHDYMYDFVKKSVIELGAKTPEELKKEGLSAKQIESITELAEAFKGDAKEAEAKLKSVVDSGDTVVSAVRNARLHEQLANPSKGNKPWTDLVKKAPAAPKFVESVKVIEDETATARVEKQREGKEAEAVTTGRA